MDKVGEEYRMTEAERFTFDLSGFLVRPAIKVMKYRCWKTTLRNTPEIHDVEATTDAHRMDYAV